MKEIQSFRRTDEQKWGGTPATREDNGEQIYVKPLPWVEGQDPTQTRYIDFQGRMYYRTERQGVMAPIYAA